MNKAINALKNALFVIGSLLAVVCTAGLVIPYYAGYNPPLATTEFKYRVRGWLACGVAWLINAAGWLVMFYGQDGALFACAFFATICVLIARACGYDANPNHFEYM